MLVSYKETKAKISYNDKVCIKKSTVALLNRDYLEAFSLKAGMDKNKILILKWYQNGNFIESMNIPLKIMIEYSKVAGYKINM